MGRYTIYFSTISEIKEYEKYLQDKKEAKKNKKPFNEMEPVKPSYLSYRDDKKPTTLDKYQVDLTTSYYKDEGDLLLRLKDHKDVIDIKGVEKNQLMAIYRANGEIKKLKLIYNNKVLYLAAKDVYRQRKEGKPISKIVISDIDELNSYIDVVKEYMRNPIYSKKLQRLFDHDTNFSVAIKNYCEHMNEKETSIDATEEIRKCLSTIEFRMHKYDVLREMILWEKRVVKEEKEVDKSFTQQEFDISSFMSKQSDIEDEIKNNLKEEIELVASEGGRDLLLREFSIEELNIMPDSFLDKYKIDTKKLERKEYRDNKNILKEYSNDIIYTYYNEGGSSYVIEQMDLDELIRYPKVVLEDVGVNIDGLGLNNGESINNGKLR